MSAQPEHAGLGHRSAPLTSPVAAGRFSVHEFTRTAQGSHRSELDLGVYRDHPLSAETTEVVDLLARLERGALAHLRSVLVTPTHNDARVTAFLVTWAYEKYWVADALELIVAAQPGRRDTPAPGGPRLNRTVRALADRVQPITESVIANLIGDDIVAVHLAAGAIDEWLVAAAYEQLADRSDNEEFTRTITSLLEVKRRHAAFFATDADERLGASTKAVRLARRRLSRTVWPLGSYTEPPVLLARLLGEIVPASELAAIDARVDALPGLEGLRPVTRSAALAWKAAR